MVQVFSDATVSFPIVAQALKELDPKRPSIPVFDWTTVGLKLSYEKR